MIHKVKQTDTHIHVDNHGHVRATCGTHATHDVNGPGDNTVDIGIFLGVPLVRSLRALLL